MSEIKYDTPSWDNSKLIFTGERRSYTALSVPEIKGYIEVWNDNKCRISAPLYFKPSFIQRLFLRVLNIRWSDVKN